MLISDNILAVFFFASILLALTPGPDNIFVLTQAAIRGRLAGWVITLGLCTGLIGHTFAVASGVAVIFQVSRIAFIALKLASAAYLLYLAYRAIRASAAKLSLSDDGLTSFFQLYRQGIIMNVTNPKVSIFFLSFLPQFTEPSRGFLMLQLLILGFVFIASSMMVFGIISIFAGLLGDRLQRSSILQTIMHRIAATVYAILAIKLATTEI